MSCLIVDVERARLYFCCVSILNKYKYYFHGATLIHYSGSLLYQKVLLLYEIDLYQYKSNKNGNAQLLQVFVGLNPKFVP